MPDRFCPFLFYFFLSLSFTDRLEEALLLALLIFTIDSPERRISISSTRLLLASLIMKDPRIIKRLSELHTFRLIVARVNYIIPDVWQKDEDESWWSKADFFLHQTFILYLEHLRFAMTKNYSARLKESTVIQIIIYIIIKIYEIHIQ